MNKFNLQSLFKRNSRQLGSNDVRSTKYFVVTSAGRAATYWLASALNSHDDVICSHSFFVPPVTVFENPPSRERALKTWDQLGTIQLTIDQYYDEIEKCGAARAYGNVHGYTLSGFLREKEKGVRRDYVVCNLVRNPVTRVESYWRRWMDVSSYNEKQKSFFRNVFETGVHHKILADKVASKFDLDFSQRENWFFINALVNIMAETSEIKLEYPHIRMEELTSDSECFRNTFKKLTSNAVAIDGKYLETIFKIGKMNQQRENSVSPKDQFEEWSPWKRYIFLEMARDWALNDAYEQVGYDLSWLN